MRVEKAVLKPLDGGESDSFMLESEGRSVRIVTRAVAAVGGRNDANVLVWWMIALAPCAERGESH